MYGNKRRYAGPAILLILATTLFFFSATRPNPEHDLGPIDLTRGATKSGVFQPKYQERYDVGLRMDQKVAAELFPCTVSVEAMQSPRCKSSATIWPVALVIKLSSEGIDRTKEIDASTATGGGIYDGTEGYIWTAVSIAATPGRSYRLDVVSTKDASLLSAAHPHLVVTAASAPGLLESRSIAQLLGTISGAFLILAAGIWTARKLRKSTSNA